MANNTPTGPDGSSHRSRLPLLAGLGFVGLLVLVGAIWLFLRDDAPAAVDLDAATAELAGEESDSADSASTDSASTDSASTESQSADSEDTSSDDDGSSDDSGDADSGAVTITDVSGDWIVDTSVGEFSFEDSTGTYVGFRVAEELTSIGETEAVGRTPEVSGTITIDGTSATAVTIEADLTAIKTETSRRDAAVQRALETGEFPTATFVLTEPIDLGADPASGDPISTTATGDLTIHGATNPVEFVIDAQLVGGTVVIVGSTEMTFSDYGVEVPTAPVVVRADDFGTVEFQLFLAKS